MPDYQYTKTMMHDNTFCMRKNEWTLTAYVSDYFPLGKERVKVIPPGERVTSEYLISLCNIANVSLKFDTEVDKVSVSI